MRDDFQIPNLGQAPNDYDIGFFNRFAKNIENMMQTVRSKGRGIFADVQTDQLEVTGPVTVTGLLAVTGSETISANLAVTGNAGVHGTLAVDGATTLTTLSAVTSATTPLLSGTTSTTTPVVITPAVQFPATQVPSSDPNTLDDYEEGTWTPTLTFATPGNLAVTYSARLGYYQKIGNRVSLDFIVNTSAFTYTTASGVFQITGLPFTPLTAAGAEWTGVFSGSGITIGASHGTVCRLVQAGTFLDLITMSGSPNTRAQLGSANFVTASTITLRGHIQYIAA